jgi:tetratricopeptide (TPR) repeat protein
VGGPILGDVPNLEAARHEQALDRLLDYYQHAAALAGSRLARQTRPGPAPAALAGQSPIPDLNEAERALAWARADRASLLACLDHAARTGRRARVIAVTAGLAELWRRDGPWTDAVARHTAALEDTRRLGNRLGEANALTDLGAVQQVTGDYPAAAHALDQALGIYRDVGNRGGEATTLNEGGTLHKISGDLARAEWCHQEALKRARTIASSWDEAHGRPARAVPHPEHDPGSCRASRSAFATCARASSPRSDTTSAASTSYDGGS